MFKRITAIFLILALCLGMFPVQVFAAGSDPVQEETVSPEETVSTEATDSTEATASTEETVPEETEPPEVTRAQWISALTKAFDMQIQDDHYPDNYFSDLTEDSPYYYDLLLAVEFGVLDIPAGGAVDPEGAATRAFAAGTLNFCLGFQTQEDQTYSFSDWESLSDPASAQVAIDRGWLEAVDGAFLPEEPITTAEMDTMLADAQAILAEDVIDEDHENTVVLSDGVVEVPMGTAVDFVSDSLLELTDCPVNLTEGDVFVVYNQDLPLAFRAAAVEQEGSITRVSYTRDGAEEALALCEYEGVLDVDLSSFQPDEEETTTYSIQRSGGSPMARGINYDDQTQTLTVTKSIKLSSGSTGNIKIVITNLRLEVKNSDSIGDYRYVLRGNATVTTDISVKDKSDLLKPLKLGVISVGGIGYITVELELNVSGTVALEWEGDIKGGFAYNVDHGSRLIHGFHKRTFTLHAKVEADLGVKVSAVIDVLLFQGSIYLKYGGKSTVQVSEHSGRVPERCLDSFSYFYAMIGVSGKLLGIAGINKPLFTIYDADNSPYRTHYHYESETADSQGKLVYKCTYSTAPAYYTPPTSENFNPSIGSGNLDSTRLYYYDLDDDDKAVITAYCGSSSIVVLPETVDEYPVAGIEEYTFYGNPKITSVKLPDSLEFISTSAFEGCTELKLVWTEGTNLTWIDEAVFRDCTALQQVILPDSVTTMGTDVFSGCSALPEIHIPSGLADIPERAFYNCTSLKGIVLPDSVTWIEEAAFYGCTSLSSINLDNVGILGKMAFYNCTALKEIDMNAPWYSEYNGYIFGNCSSLTKVNLYEGITHIPDYLFQGCTGLRNLVLPDTVKTLGRYCYAECTGLKSVVIPEAVTEIPEYAFSGCTSLTDVQLPEDLRMLQDNAFGGCTALEELTIPRWARVHEENVYNANYPFIGCTGLKTVTIAPGAKSVPCCLLSGCSSVETVILPDSIQEIEEKAFFGCSSLRNVEFGGSQVTTIGNRAFAYCMSLETFVMPDTVINLGDYAFTGSGVQEVQLSSTLESIGEYAFYQCSYLGKINIPASLRNVPISKDEAFNIECGVFLGCPNLKEVVLEEGVTEIFIRMFNHCDGIEYIEIPSSVTRIDSYAFYDCSNLKTVIFHGEVQEIGDYAFCATDLRWLDLPEGLKTIGRNAFSYCSWLQEVRLPDTLEIIDQQAFYNCRLTRVDLPENLKELRSEAFAYNDVRNWVIPKSARYISNSGLGQSVESITLEEGATRVPDYLMAATSITSTDALILPDSVTEFGEGVFMHCTELTDVNLPDSVTVLGDSLFENCTALTSVELPDSVTSIGANAFQNCTGLTSVALSESLSTIGDGAFTGCTGLTSIEMPDSLSIIGDSAFAGCSGLTSVRLSDSLSTIGSSAFRSCAALTELTVPGNVTVIGEEAFSGCSGLQTLEIRAALQTLGSRAFADCSALTSVELPGTLTEIPMQAFQGCTAMTQVTLPASLTSIGASAFRDCGNLLRIDLPEKVIRVADHAFEGCGSLETVTTGDVLDSLGEYAFASCQSLENVTLGASLRLLDEYVFYDCTALEELTLPCNLTEISHMALGECISLKRLYIGEKLQNIARYFGNLSQSPEVYGVSNSYAHSWAQSNGYTFYPITVEATDMTWAMEDMTLRTEESVYITHAPVVTPANATSPVVYTSSDPEVVTVKGDYLQGVAPGTATVTATIDGLAAEFEVTVVQAMSNVTLDVTEAALNGNETLQLNAGCVIEGTTNQNYIWSSSTNCASVDQNGLVTALSKGSATITAAAADGSGYKATCKVTVLNTVETVTDFRSLKVSYTNNDGEQYYPSNLDHCLIYTVENARSITLVFHPNTALEFASDYLYFYDGEDQLVNSFTGTSESRQWTCHVWGDTVKIRMVTDEAGTDWGYAVVDVIVDMACSGHSYTSVQSGEPTCIKSAVVDYTCTLCGHHYQETVPALGHDYVEAQTEATCTTAGYKHRSCLRCGVHHRYKQTQEPLGHSYVDVRTDPGCETGGYITSTCERCGDSYQHNFWEPLGHDVYEGTCWHCGKIYVKIVTQPVSVTVEDGETAAITVEAQGEGLTYRWYYKNSGSDTFLLTNAFAGPEYSVTMSEARHGRQVYCVVTCAEGYSVTSETATLFLASKALEIVSQSENLTVPAGETAELTVVVNGEGLTYEWYCRKSGEADFQPDATVTGPTWAVTMSEEWDGCEVYCGITDLYGRTVYSYVMTVSLPRDTAQIIRQPQDTEAAEGEMAEVTVEAAGDGLTYAWFCRKAGETEFSRYEAYTGTSWFVTMGTLWDGCEVYCEITDRFGNMIRSRVATLSMTDGGLRILQDIGSVIVASGETATVTVEAAGEDLTYVWYRMDVEDYWFEEEPGITGNSYSVVMSEAVDGRQVYCCITDRNGETLWTNTATLSMEGSRLRIIMEPDSDAAAAGDPVFVNLKAAGAGLCYAWYFCAPGDDAFSLSEGYTGTGYTVIMDESVDGCRVYCEISDIYGNTIRTKIVTLRLKGREPVIVTDIADVTAASGETAAVTVEATGEDLTYEWYFMNAGGSKFSKTIAFTGPSYSVTMREDRDGRQIYCVITDRYGYQVQTNTATLSMAKKELSVIRWPSDVTAYPGEKAEVSLEAYGDGLTYEWYFRNPGSTGFSKTDAFTGPSYSVTMREDRDGRQLYCVITDRYGNQVQTNTVTLSLKRSAPVIVTQPADVTVAAGGPAEVYVEASGDGLTYQWYFRNAGGSRFSLTTAFTGPTYSVVMNEARSGRQVYCVITDAYGSTVTTETATLTMWTVPLEILTQPESVSVAEGETAAVTVKATGEGLTYEWYYRNSAAGKFTKTTAFTGSTYSVSMNGSRDGRQVYCVITDKYGTSVTTETVTLSMLPDEALEILSQPEGFTIASGEAGEIYVEATGDGLTYEWYYKNAAGSKFTKTGTFTGPAYTLTMNASRSGRHVYCVITDKYGNSIQTDIVTLNMESDLELLSQPEDIAAAVGETVAVTAEAVGEELTYTWYYRSAGADSFTKTDAFTGDTYSLKMTAARTGRQVYCVIRDGSGNTVATDIVTLNKTN